MKKTGNRGKSKLIAQTQVEYEAIVEKVRVYCQKSREI